MVSMYTDMGNGERRRINQHFGMVSSPFSTVMPSAFDSASYLICSLAKVLMTATLLVPFSGSGDCLFKDPLEVHRVL